MNGYQSPPAPLDDDDDMRSLMLERLSIVAAKGGLEMEEKMKTFYGHSGIRECSFLWSSDPYHKLYKQKIAEYTKSPPPPPPIPRDLDILDSHTDFAEQFALCSDTTAFSLGIPQGMMRKELDIIMLTAQFVARYGIPFWDALWDRVSTQTQFKFLDRRRCTNDITCYFFRGIFAGYGRLIKRWEDPLVGMEAVVEVFFTALKKMQEDEGEDEVVDKVETERRDFVVTSDEYFVEIENTELLITAPPPMRHAFRVTITRGGGIIRNKELGIIKFTAQFVVRYGEEFWDALWDRVSTQTEFQFLEKGPLNDRSRSRLFFQLLLAYGRVIFPWEIPPRKMNKPARMEPVLQGFFTAFNAFKGKQAEEGDEVVDKVVTDRRDFVVGAECFRCFLDIEERTPLPERLQMLHEEELSFTSAFRVGIPQNIMRKELDIINFTAQFVARYGIQFWDALWDRVTHTQFKFLDEIDTHAIMCSFFRRIFLGYGHLIKRWEDPLDIMCYLFRRIFLAYGHLIKRWEHPLVGMEAVVEVFFTALKKRQEGEGDDEVVVDKVETDRRDFVVSSEEYFADIEDKQLLITAPPPMHHAFRVGIGGMMRKELGIIKFTAQFVVRYGDEFWDALWDRVSTQTEFQFLKRNPGNDTLFSQLLLAYGNVIFPWEIPPRKMNKPARMEAVLEGFFTAFNAFKGKQEEEGDEVVDKVETDRRDFVVGAECFQCFLDIEDRTPLPERLQMLHEEEPEAKRAKLDESALVSEEEFLAQHQGWSSILISNTIGRVFQIIVESLSENVASLKEKIAGETGIPANQQKLRGRTGVLEDHMSLAHYNVGGKDMLTLD